MATLDTACSGCW